MSEDVPLPKVNQRYKDDHGALVTLTSVEKPGGVYAGRLSASLHATDVQLSGKIQTRTPGRNRIKRNPCRQSHYLIAA